jgi:hypothetical protein
MEIKDDEFQTLRQRVDQISSELDKQNTVRVVNTKWMVIIGAVIVSALGFTSFVKIPQEADRAVEKKIEQDIMFKAKELARIYKEVEESDLENMPIGTIIPSMLDPILFKDSVAFPDKWELAKGQKVSTEWKYYKVFGEGSRIPDLRGMFLRGMNEGRNDGEQDPEQNRKPGDEQKDALQQHSHNITVNGKKMKVTALKWHDPSTDLGYTSTGKAHAPEVSMTVTNVTGEDVNVADETRPKNVAVYFYIKIN